MNFQDAFSSPSLFKSSSLSLSTSSSFCFPNNCSSSPFNLSPSSFSRSSIWWPRTEDCSPRNSALLLSRSPMAVTEEESLEGSCGGAEVEEMAPSGWGGRRSLRRIGRDDEKGRRRRRRQNEVFTGCSSISTLCRCNIRPRCKPTPAEREMALNHSKSLRRSCNSQNVTGGEIGAIPKPKIANVFWISEIQFVDKNIDNDDVSYIKGNGSNSCASKIILLKLTKYPNSAWSFTIDRWSINSIEKPYHFLP